MTEKYYMEEMFAFLRELDANNNREWFRCHKEKFEGLRRQWLADLDRVVTSLAADDPALRGLTGADCAFRIYRDTRFSPDKRPFKSYISASITHGGRNAHAAGIYLHFSPFDDGESGVFGGIWCPPSAELKKLRRAIVDNIEEWEEIMTSEPFTSGTFDLWTSRSLKTAPQGWPKDHPQIRYLRMTDYGMFAHLRCDELVCPDWPERVTALARQTFPFTRFLNYSLHEED